jgi:N6-L-threonylcarbamoyladenine synthase
MIIMGIETSCDDTGVAIVKISGKKRPVFNILSNVVSSQIKTHAPYGGVVPNLAARDHLKNIVPCLKTALNEAKIAPKDIDLIAVTVGPGLIPSLLIGVNFAKALAYAWKKPIIAVNHLEGHIAAALIPSGRGISNFKFLISKTPFPAVALVVSGGHTQLVLVRKIGGYKIIGETRDDAAGECFDKVAKLLGLGYPGGPVIAAQAAKFLISNFKFQNKSKISNFKLPRPMIQHKNYDFSFSGLKTAVLYLVKSQKSKIKSQNFIQEVCHETQEAIIDVLIDKTLRAAEEYRTKTIILSGGVAANEELRKQFELKIKKLKLKINFLVPPRNLCTDNGAMIAMAGYFEAKRHPAPRDNFWRKINADANLRIG